MSVLLNKQKKIILCVLVAGAAVSAGFAFSGMGYADNETQAVEEGPCYVLRDYEGYVAVFVENDPSCPMTVTDIQTSTLRQVDRDTLQTGLKIRSKERLMMILEDLGS